ncbi:hypothetical protein ASPVEDRAFT_46601 [Aspergillus versicolor CBS 583.65]|uniref:AB hydrolase-1 domain-containing protein n=1 Tax=Aspergillus versicolor CBS 583.65 TaxID=1036611 RepID=A0A1L9Q0G2_ASPVE|nr:uncharacterized protein ASPVEDRAFT_46601 [Aspergillus versicolor CBS 583.65]OJJ07250.1 hypothetical protein ASPVEDRAFT_46601 [Aspergillus versicolor CBS 583.65]
MHIRPSYPKKTRPRPGLLHEYAERLVAFEYATAGQVKPHTLLFIPGLGDGLGTVAYLDDIAAALEHTEWSVFSPVLSSSYGGWGMSGLGRDIDEMALCLEYIVEYKRGAVSSESTTSTGTCTEPEIRSGSRPGKIVIMGHSTGSQDVLQYISSINPRHPHPVLDRGGSAPPILRPQVDGAIMQAPVSDREAILTVLKEGNRHHTAEEMQMIYDRAIAGARKDTFEKDGLDTVVPLPYTASIGYPGSTAISSRRFLSLASPDSPRSPGEDDLFSSDLGEERLRKTFGMVRERGVLRGAESLLVLYSGSDPSVPAHVDKEALLKRWRRVTDADREIWHAESGIIPWASHTLEGPDQVEQRRILVHKLHVFLTDIENDVPK